MIKRYFIVVLLLSLFPAGVSAQRRAAAKKDWKTKYDYVGAVHDGRILVHRGGEGSNPRMGRFYTDGCFGYTDTCGTVVIPLIYDYADSFSNGFAVVGKGEKNDRRFGLIDRQGCEVVPCIYADVAGFSSGLARVQEYEVSSFQNGRAVVCIVSGGALKYGSIDRNGREILPCIYDWVQHTPFGTTWVGEGEDFASRACTLLDVSGKPLIDYKVYQVNPSGKFGHASAAVPDSTGLLRFGVLDGRGRVIIPFEYDDITIFSEWDSAATAYVERGIAEVKGKKYPFALRRGE